MNFHSLRDIITTVCVGIPPEYIIYDKCHDKFPFWMGAMGTTLESFAGFQRKMIYLQDNTRPNHV